MLLSDAEVHPGLRTPTPGPAPLPGIQGFSRSGPTGPSRFSSPDEQLPRCPGSVCSFIETLARQTFPEHVLGAGRCARMRFSGGQVRPGPSFHSDSHTNPRGCERGKQPARGQMTCPGPGVGEGVPEGSPGEGRTAGKAWQGMGQYWLWPARWSLEGKASRGSALTALS